MKTDGWHGRARGPAARRPRHDRRDRQERRRSRSRRCDKRAHRLCPNGRELMLVNGRIHTMDASGSSSSLRHDPQRPVRVGGPRQRRQRRRRSGLQAGDQPREPPGPARARRQPQSHPVARTEARLPHAARIRGIVRGHPRDLPGSASSPRPSGAFITTIGGFNPVQFAEKRLPNLTELDAIAPGNPVYLQVSFTGPSTTNSAGRAFFSGKGVTVGADGSIAANTQTVAALNALRSVQTFDDKKRGTIDAMTYAAKLGVTTHMDMGGFLIPGSPNHEDEFTFDGAASWDPYVAYEPILELNRQELMKVRIRVNYLTHGQRLVGSDPSAAHRQRVSSVRQRMAERRGTRRIHHQLAAVRAGRAARELCDRDQEGSGARLDLFAAHALVGRGQCGDHRLGAVEHADPDRAAALVDCPRDDDHPSERAAPQSPRRRTRAARFPLPGRHADRERSAVPDDRRQRHQGRRRLGQRADLGAQPLADAVLHGHRQEQLRSADQRRADAVAPGSASPVHGGERMVQQGGRQDRHDRNRQVRRPDRPQRRLLRVPEESIKQLGSILTVVGGRIVQACCACTNADQAGGPPCGERLPARFDGSRRSARAAVRWPPLRSSAGTRRGPAPAGADLREADGAETGAA